MLFLSSSSLFMMTMRRRRNRMIMTMMTRRRRTKMMTMMMVMMKYPLTTLGVLQGLSGSADHGGVGVAGAHHHGEGGIWDVGVVQLDVHVVHAVLLGDEAHAVHARVHLLHEAVRVAARGRAHPGVEAARGPVEVDCEGVGLVHLPGIGGVRECRG